MKKFFSLSFGLFLLSLFLFPASTQAGEGMMMEECNQFLTINQDGAYNYDATTNKEYNECLKKQQYQHFLRELDQQLQIVKSIASDIKAMEETFSADIPSEKRQMTQKLIRLTGFYSARAEQRHQELIEFSKTDSFDPYNYYGYISSLYRYQSRLEAISQQLDDIILGRI
jgi:hypothetical protein